MTNTMENAVQLLRLATCGNSAALGELLEQYSSQLTRIVKIRMDRRLQSRVDATDVIQEAFMEAINRFPEFVSQDKLPFFLWLRLITLQKLMQTHRFHLSTQARNANREISIYQASILQATSAVLAAQLLGNFTSPTQAASRKEEKLKLENALNDMDEINREVLVLRHFEKLSVVETAKLLDLSESGVRKRYLKSLSIIKTKLE